MARQYSLSIADSANIAGVFNSYILANSLATTRLWVTEVGIGSNTDGANSQEVVLATQTATDAGGLALTPQLMDTLDPSAATTAREGTATAFTTLAATSTILDFGINQRATFRYIFQPGREAKFNKATNVGAVLYPKLVSSPFACTAMLIIEE